MKKILVCADFSASSRHTARYALLLAIALKTDLMLMHVIETGKNHSPPLLLEPFEEIEGRALEMLCDLRLLLESDLSKTLGQKKTPRITVEVIMGNLREIADNMFSSKLISMTCLGIGRRGITAVLLPGSMGARMREAASLPMLFVPLSAQLLLPEKMGLAVGTSRPKARIVSFLTALCAFAQKVMFIICPSPATWLSNPSQQDEKLLNSAFPAIPAQKISYLHIRKTNTRETELFWCVITVLE